MSARFGRGVPAPNCSGKDVALAAEKGAACLQGIYLCIAADEDMQPDIVRRVEKW